MGSVHNESCLNYEIIASGSRGNCVVIEDIMIDCGVPFKKIKGHLYDKKYLLLTHIHGDHIKPKTLENIKRMFPKITIIGNWEVHQQYGVNIVCNAGFEVVTDYYTFLPFECNHDVLTYGFTWKYQDNNIIYVTDTGDMKNAPTDRKYDYFFMESNHDQRIIDQIDSSNYGYDVQASATRHLSTQQGKGFFYTNRRNKKAVWEELHKSTRFY